MSEAMLAMALELDVMRHKQELAAGFAALRAKYKQPDQKPLTPEEERMREIARMQQNVYGLPGWSGLSYGYGGLCPCSQCNPCGGAYFSPGVLW